MQNEVNLKNWKPIKKSISLRIDLDNLEWLQGDNPKGYQKRLNCALRWARQNGYNFETKEHDND